MKWDHVAYQDGDGHYWRVGLGHGEEVYCDSLYPHEWIASWFSGGHDVEIARCPTVAEAKAAAEHWLRVRVTAWENALACCELQDDGE